LTAPKIVAVQLPQFTEYFSGLGIEVIIY